MALTKISYPDSSFESFGTDGDQAIWHTGSAGYIRNSTGGLCIRNDAFSVKDDGESETMLTATKDGSVDLYYNNTKFFETTSSGVKCTRRIDVNDDDGNGQGIAIGNSQDMTLFHGGGNSFIKNITGGLDLRSNTIHLRNEDNDETYLKAVDDGGVELYYDNTKRFETTSAGVTVTGNILPDGDSTRDLGSSSLQFNDAFFNGVSLKDNKKILLGTGNDLEIYHDGSHSYIDNTNGTGNIYIKDEIVRVRAATSFGVDNADGTETALLATLNGAVELYYDNSKKFETKSYGVNMPDNSQLYFGSGDDLVIKHDGTNSYIGNATGDLYIENSNASGSIYITKGSGGQENMAYFSVDGGVGLYYDNSKKFETQGQGVKVLNGGLDLARDNNLYQGAIYFAGVTDTNHMLWNDYWNHPNSARTTTDSWDGMKWNTYNGLILYGASNEGETLAKFNTHAGCQFYYNDTVRLESTNTGATVHGSLYESSDIALKTNIQPINNVLDKIQQITGYKYQFKNNGHDSMGVTAQDVEKVFPELVYGEEGTKTLQYSGLIGALIESVKELSNKVAALEAA